ncbi:3-hydroxyacyl-CoA dehydrogenase family protein [Falsiroseomonas selenitidurans]|uniref:3-hydroxyacyl-CoA dehydrogenase family protein n=1 Tax=Falsiroseomonas selenitidurans TaxID=2716335 RepID=A0ABX1EBP5_9PROT|nr:3-hydroxyacyl-CoA dehydrogenase family protein [Falsiroseomonas selenitidurans]NKC32902.1 3-hydroxyacyl-CoA dehydrogenase family protein [Falsiroseomonas selenitidurans]
MGIKVAVIGAGTMGHALALVFALGGHEVRLTDSSMATLEKAGGLMQTALETLVVAGEAPREADAEWLHQAVTRLPVLAEAVEEADLVLEAISENPEAKRALFAEVDRLAPPAAILASNTSYLDPFPLIPARRQDRAVIMHWYTPPYLVDLVDIVGGPQCDPAVVDFAAAFCRAMGKRPVVMRKFVPGYIANRVQSAIAMEVQKLLDDGVATAEEIDTAIIEGIALRLPILGVLAKADFTGLAFTQASLANRMYAPPPVRGQCEAVDALVAAGRTGVMAGAGFYDWPGETAAVLEARDRRLLALKRALRQIGTMAGQGREA